MSDELAGVALTHLDDELFEGAGATKRDLVGYLDAVADRMVPVLSGRPLSVIRVRPGSPPFMQKNLPKYAPEWIARTVVWSPASYREITYALGDDHRTLIWFGNQRAVEYHVTLSRADDPAPTHLVIDLDPPEGAPFSAVVATAALVRQALADTGLAGAVKTSGAKGLHVFVPLLPGVSWDDAAGATRALAARAAALDPGVATPAYIVQDREGKVFVDSTRSGGGTVAAAYSPRARPGAPVSFPLGWDDLGSVSPADFTLHTAVAALGSGDPWAAAMPDAVALPEDLLEQGRAIPVARVAAMHEGKRRKRAARTADGDGS
ncbi:ATP-dependent DNA ligase [Nakamurella flavida]|uniref:ATP-dependent DNA ligase n=1 Tax=Nakamurella flavida TaxID=363630 RepID=A0A939C2T6_9ACTN|nr:ATP-dependent DNA ligase [Nakamurella flavida]MBM9476925.1 ATP-dependent DNA ligase [Nakamurella flavida]MDP9779870.1 DNA ligase D-like protein (predicted polymerase) [Nakamurella flavida]